MTEPVVAVVADPAPAPVVPVVPAVTSVESAPADPVVLETPAPAVEEEKVSPKTVEELKTQRRKRQEAEKEVAYLRGKLEGRGAEPPPVPEVVPSAPAVPKLDQFETYEQYEAAKDEYLLSQAEHRVGLKYQAEQQRQKVVAIEQTFQGRMEAAIKEDPALAELMQDRTLPISVAMLPTLKESDVAPQLIRWLDQNRDEGRRIAQLSPLQAAREIGALEAKIKFTPVPEPPRRVSSAPEPVNPVSPSSPTSVDEAELPMEEYHKRRTKKIFGR